MSYAGACYLTLTMKHPPRAFRVKGKVRGHQGRPEYESHGALEDLTRVYQKESGDTRGGHPEALRSWEGKARNRPCCVRGACGEKGGRGTRAHIEA